jgi:polyisoprenoid-binding protein YceI
MTIDVPPPGRYELDSKHSSIAFVATHGFGSKINGTFAISGGSITVDERVALSKVVAVIDAASVDTGNKLRDTEVRSPLFLKTKTYPTFDFESSDVTQSDGAWAVRGSLTARGTTAPAEFTITSLTTNADGFDAVATARTDRYAHGVRAARGVAGRHLELTISVTARRV